MNLQSVKTIFLQPLKALRVSSCCSSYQVEQKFKESNSNIKNHCFKNLFPWKTLPEFCESICSSVVYNKNGLVAINKPYGVKIMKSKKAKVSDEVQDIRHSVAYASHVDFPFSMEETLTDLKKYLGVSDLTILKSAERYSSGLVLMATDQRTVARVKKSFNVAKANKMPHLVYWAITNHCPIETARREKIGLRFIDIEFRSEKQPIIVTDYSHRDVIHRRVKTYLVEFRTLAVNREVSTSLLEIATSSTTFHFLRLYASSRVASILGDTLYGSRMRTVFGKPIMLNPHNIVAYDVQPLPQKFCEKLSLPETVNGHLMVPTMLHFQTVVLAKYENGQDLLISAPLPSHYNWSCVKLELLPENISLKELE